MRKRTWHLLLLLLPDCDSCQCWCSPCDSNKLLLLLLLRTFTNHKIV